jgi:hypothetical protein
MTDTPQETSSEVRRSIQAGLDAYLAALATGMDGDSTLFTNYFMRLSTSGTLWSPGDAIGHYQNSFVYDRLHEAWRLDGRPEETLPVIADDTSPLVKPVPTVALWASVRA